MRIFCALVFLFATTRPVAQPTVVLEQVAEGLGYITDIAHAGDDRLFILTRHGLIRVIQDGMVLPDPYLDITSQVTTSGEMGALGLAFDPEFQQNGRFYVHYNPSGGVWQSRIARFTAATPAANTVDAATQQIVLIVPQAGSFHNGGDVDFGHDGMLYMTLGDSFQSENSQDLTHPLGSILRIDVSDGGDTYAIPADNPYANATGDTLKTIWAKGLRNPFRFGFDALTGDVWIGDVGSVTWEEVNFWPAGDHSGPNFGWKCYEGFAPNNTTGCGPITDYVMPVAVQPTSGAWCSVIGGRVYRGSEFAALYGRYIYTDYCAGLIYSLLSDGDGGWLHEQLSPSIGNGNICIGENSALELFLGKSNGTLHRIVDPLTVAIHETRPSELVIHPNPASDLLVIEGDLRSIEALEVYDRAGRLLLNVPVAANSDRATLNVSQLASGTYLLMTRDASGGRSGQIVGIMR